jgi:hypothetical protein
MKRMRIRRGWIVTAVLVAVIVASVPGAIARLIATRDPYLFSKVFFDDMIARLSGAGRFRFFVQPVVSAVIGVRHGLTDARNGTPPIVRVLISNASQRSAVLRAAFVALRDLVAVAIVLDIVSQAVIFGRIHPLAAILLGPVLIAVPYVFARTVAHSLTRPPKNRDTTRREAA